MSDIDGLSNPADVRMEPDVAAEAAGAEAPPPALPEPEPEAAPATDFAGSATAERAHQSDLGARMLENALSLDGVWKYISDQVFGEKKPAEQSARPEYVDIGTMDHDRRVCDAGLAGKPLTPPGEPWQGARILNSLSQLEATADAGKDYRKSRCGPSSLLAAAVMAGPEATAGFAERLAAVETDPKRQQELNGIRDRILDGTATVGDLNRLQDIALANYADEPDKGLGASEIWSMERDLARSVKFDREGSSTTEGGTRVVHDDSEIDEQPGRTAERMAGLASGESFTLMVDTDGDGRTNHFVQVGRDESGKLYVYDPYPRANQPNILYQDQNPEAFKHYTDGSMGWRPPGQPMRINVVYGGTVSF